MSDKTLQDLKLDAHIAVLHTKVDALIEKQKELTGRVRANEKVVAAIGLLGSISLAFIGAGYFAPRAEAYPEYLEPREQYIEGSLPDNSNNIQGWMNKMKAWETQERMKDAEFDINSALAEYFNNGVTDTSEQEELLQFQSDLSGQSIGWRYD